MKAEDGSELLLEKSARSRAIAAVIGLIRGEFLAKQQTVGHYIRDDAGQTVVHPESETRRGEKNWVTGDGDRLDCTPKLRHAERRFNE